MLIQRRCCIFVILCGALWMVFMMATFSCFGPSSDSGKKERKYNMKEFADIPSGFQTNYPVIFVVTPTYTRPVQKAELTRFSHTLLHVKNIHWIVVEDSPRQTELVKNFLHKTKLNSTHLSVTTPENYKLGSNDPNWLKPRGVLQRNSALEWIRTNVNPKTSKGVVYFADDDNTYDLEVFEEMRTTKIVSVWPVGLVGGLRYESPIVENGRVTGWYTFWKPERPFAMDMAGFAINVQLLFDNPEARFDLHAQRGYQESSLLSGLISMGQLEPKANHCTKVLVWHTRTEKADFKNEKKFQLKGLPGSDLHIEV